MKPGIERTLIDGIEVVTLQVGDTIAKIIPRVGNLVYSLQFKGDEFLWFPFDSPKAFKDQPRLAGIPLLAPWANRLEWDGFKFQGITYPLNSKLEFPRDSNGLPMHGLLAFTDNWQLETEKVHDESVEVSASLDFSSYSTFLTHFPFSHRLELSYRLSSSRLEIDLKIVNTGEQSMSHFVYTLIAVLTQHQILF